MVKKYGNSVAFRNISPKIVSATIRKYHYMVYDDDIIMIISDHIMMISETYGNTRT